MTTVITPGMNLETIAYGDVTAQQTGLNVACQAVAIQVKGTLMNLSTSDSAWVLLKELWAYEKPDRECSVKLTATSPPATQDEIYDAAAYNKLLDSSIGSPHIVMDDVGESTDIEARAYARRMLMNGLKLAARRTYRCQANLPATLPEKGDTVTMPDAFTGVCLGYTFSLNDGAESITLEPVSYTHLTLPTNREV